MQPLKAFAGRLGYFLLAVVCLLMVSFTLWENSKQVKISCKPNQKEILCEVEERSLYGLFAGDSKSISAQPTSATLHELTNKKIRKTSFQLFWDAPTGRFPLTNKIINSRQEFTDAKERLNKFLLEPSPIEIHIQAGRDSWGWLVFFIFFLFLAVIFGFAAWVGD